MCVRNVLLLTAALVLAVATVGCKQKSAKKGSESDSADQGAMGQTMGPKVDAMRPVAKPAARPSATQPKSKGLMARKDAVILARKFVELLRVEKWKEARALYAPKMRKTFKEAQLKKVWVKLVSQFGKFEKFDKGVWILPKGDLAFVFLPCWWQKGKFDLIIPIRSTLGVAGIRLRFHEHHGEFPSPPYAVQTRFDERQVVVGKGTDWELPGTLSAPKSSKSVPAVVLVHGSGPQDRDLTFGPNKAYRDLAWGLASRGIAVLRYDKRTKVHAQRMLKLKKKLTHVEEYVNDTLAAVKLLVSMKTFHPIYVVGHSDGGYTVPLIVKLAGGKVAGGVLLAAPSRQLFENYLEQIVFMAKMRKVSDQPSVKAHLARLKKAIQKAKDPNLSAATPNRELPMGASAQYWLARRAYKHKEIARAFKGPLLVLNGKRDYQVTATDFNGWKTALRGKGNAFFRMYPKLNHFLIKGEGSPNPKEYYHSAHMDVRVIEDIAHFVLKQQLKK
jgi:uncharacterized protein